MSYNFQSRKQILTLRGVYWKKVENFGKIWKFWKKISKVGGKFWRREGYISSNFFHIDKFVKLSLLHLHRSVFLLSHRRNQTFPFFCCIFLSFSQVNYNVFFPFQPEMSTILSTLQRCFNKQLQSKKRCTSWTVSVSKRTLSLKFNWLAPLPLRSFLRVN